jgi:UDP-glucose 4-epimerase
MILLTGGMGFIGLHTARALLDAGEDVVLTRFRTWRLPDFLEPELDARLHVETVDMADGWGLLDVLRRHAVTSVVHLAVPALGTGPAQEYGSAVQGLVNVLEAARQHGARRVSVASSLAVYGRAGAGPWCEDAPLAVESASHTEAAKKAMEVIGLHYADRTGLEVLMLRLAAIYGPLYHSMANLPSRLCHAAVAGAQPDLAGVRGGVQYAEDAGDLCHVRDCADGIRLLHLAPSLRHRVYNVGAGVAVTNGEVAAAVGRAVPGATIALPSRAAAGGGPARPYMDITRIQEETAYAPSHDIDSGVADYVAWLRDHAA